MLVDFEHRINVEAEYQRGKVWSKPQQALLIDSILRNFDIPKIFLRKLPDGSEYLFDVIDGKQRLTALWRFFSDDFRLFKNEDPLPHFGDLGGKCWSELPNDAKDQLQFANITVSKIEDTTEDEIRDLFLRLQQGEPLNAAEKRNAIAGPVRDFVAKTLAQHSFWGKTALRTARMGMAEHSAILLELVRKGGPTGLKGADLYDLYQQGDFDPRGEVALRTLDLFNTIDKVATVQPGAIRTRWGLVDLFGVLMKLQNEEVCVPPEQISNFFVEFERKRRSIGTQLSDLQTKVVDFSIYHNTPENEIPQEISLAVPDISSDMLSYYLSFSREGAAEENVRTRTKIMYQRLMDHLTDPSGK